MLATISPPTDKLLPHPNIWWQIIQNLREFMAECNGERIIKIGPYLPKLSPKEDCVDVLV